MLGLFQTLGLARNPGTLARGSRRAPAVGVDQNDIVIDDLSRPVFGVMGIPLDAVGLSTVVRSIQAASSDKRRYLISTPNVNFLVSAQSSPVFRESLLGSELCPVDGAPIVAIAKLLGLPIRERVAGSDTFECLTKIKPESPLRVFLFGGTDQALELLSSQLSSTTGMRSVGHLNPGFGTVEELSHSRFIEEINASQADLLAVFLSSAKAQAWLARNHKLLTVPVRFDFGGTINFQTGLVRRAPLRVRQFGIEWLWRIKEEPGLWRRYWDDGLQLIKLLIFQAAPFGYCLLRYRMAEAKAFSFDLDRQSSQLLVKLSGDAVEDHIEPATEMFRQVCSAKKDVMVDLTKATFIDPRFFGLLLMVRKTLGLQGRSLRFAGMDAKIRRLFLLNGFGYLFDTR